MNIQHHGTWPLKPAVRLNPPPLHPRTEALFSMAASMERSREFSLANSLDGSSNSATWANQTRGSGVSPTHDVRGRIQNTIIIIKRDSFANMQWCHCRKYHDTSKNQTWELFWSAWTWTWTVWDLSRVTVITQTETRAAASGDETWSCSSSNVHLRLAPKDPMFRSQ